MASCGSAAPVGSDSTGSSGQPALAGESSSSSGSDMALESTSGRDMPTTDTGGGTSSSTGPSDRDGTSTGSCGCGEVEIGPSEPTPAGYSFEDAVGSVPDADVPFVWVGIEGDPTTTVHVHVQPSDGMASYQQGCGEDCVGVSGRALLVIDSDDGVLAEQVAGFLTIVPGESASLDIVSNALGEYTGTLPDQMFDQVTDNAGIAIAWDLSRASSTPSVSVYSPGGFGSFVIGESVDG